MNPSIELNADAAAVEELTDEEAKLAIAAVEETLQTFHDLDSRILTAVAVCLAHNAINLESEIGRKHILIGAASLVIVSNMRATLEEKAREATAQKLDSSVPTTNAPN